MDSDIKGRLSEFHNPRPEKMEFDAETGKLRVVKAPNPDLSVVQTNMSCSFFGGGNLVASSAKDKITLKPKSWIKRDMHVKTMHISCKSDRYQEAHNYAGVIIYQYNGKSDWRTANNTHCKSGYIVIQDTDSENVEKLKSEEFGQVHGAVYRNAFGEPKTKSVVGEGFAIQNGEIKFNSGVFNNPQGSVFHDDHRWMNELSKHCVRKIVEEWMTAGLSGVKQRNFEVKELLGDFDYEMNSIILVDKDNSTRSCNIL
ncbi:Hypothetical predicted protein [Paramuricea clavata]|uniref:Uncharacterized protein n=1 Tax=Paramuricea clavata TaxID=317549 RepID=A0A7D9EU07_PARCT|nr:Hypothetical predicted protein [Paramuricea clavata]